MKTADAVLTGPTSDGAAARQTSWRAVWAWLIGGAVVVLTWSVRSLAPNEPGGDHDYVLLVSEALHTGLHHGTDVSTTYGPLAFIAVPSMTHPVEVMAGFGLWFGLALVSVLLLHAGLKTRVGNWWAWLAVLVIMLSLAVVPMAGPPTAGAALVVAVSLVYAAGAMPRRIDRIAPIFLALFVAAMLLMKISVGVVGGVALVGAILARSDRRWSALRDAIVTGIVALVLFWVLTLQPLLTLPGYLLQSLSVGGGYSDAMGLEVPGKTLEYAFVPIVIVLVGWAVSRVKIVGAPVVLWVAYLIAFWLTFKQGFVRHDAHSVQFWATCTAVLIVAALLSVRRWLAFAAAGTIALQAAYIGPGVVDLNPVKFTEAFVNGWRSVVSTDYRNARLDDARAELTERLQLPQDLVDYIGNDTMRSEPFDWAIWWTYGRKVAVLPTILNYGAYTPSLDEMNAKWVEDDVRAPKFLVRQNTAITLDWRQPMWDPPQTQLEQACRYRLVPSVSTAQWLLLERTGHTCGEQVLLGSAEVSAGQAVRIPTASDPESLVIARVYPERSVANRIATFLFKPGDLWVTLSPADRSRLPWTQSGAPLIVHAPSDIANAMPEAVGVEGATLSMDRPGRIEFFEVPVE